MALRIVPGVSDLNRTLELSMWKNILVPHDFSPCAARALGVAGDLARVHGAKITLLHVSDLPENVAEDSVVEPCGDGSAVALSDYARQGSLRRLEQIVEPLRSTGLSIATRTATGDIAEEILSAARTLRADVLVVGTHGRTGLSHLVLGSVAEKLVRHAPLPVLCVRSRSPEAELTTEEQQAEDELAG